jgi:hypothetical protein
LETFLDSKRELSGEISEIAGIDEKYFWPSVDPIYTASIATRMSWASKIKSTRREYMAYCLIALFDVDMRLLLLCFNPARLTTAR